MVTQKRKVLKGTVISGGIVIGNVRVILSGRPEIAEYSIPPGRINKELEALDQAVESTLNDLRHFSESAGKKVVGPVAKIFDAQLLIAGDHEFLKRVKADIIKTRRNAGFIYNKMIKETIIPLKNSSDTYIRQMTIDIEAVANRVLSFLNGGEKCDLRFQPNTILVSKSFTPGEVLDFRQRKAIGFIVSEGGHDSHMALIARGLLIPVVLTKEAHRLINDNSRLIVDGVRGQIIINPTDEDIVEYQKLRKKQGPANIARIKKLSHFPPQTSDGQVIHVGANLSLPGPVDEILSTQTIPVGLYRTEFIYLSHGDFPGEKEQTEFYKNISNQYKKSSVVLRTFDLGSDKLVKNSNWPQENNPALGWRGIRAMLDMDATFKTQIRAILKASGRGNLKIMLPMISDVTEVDRAKRLIRQVKFQLRREKIAFDDNIQVGIMVEVPSAALSADALAKKVDFISIGTNDLTQYTLAADRMNDKVAHLYNSYHPAVLNLISMTVKASKKRNIPVSICGEIAGDLMALPLFIGLGLDMLSMNPARIFDLCRLVNKIDAGTARVLTESVLKSRTLNEVLNQLSHYKEELDKKKTIRKRK